MKPCVSVIIPSYNYGQFISSTLKSVLEQRKVELDVIVVDDGSSDNTAEVVKEFGSSVRYVYQENQGPCEARNTGMRLAQGEFLVFLDADDLLSPDTLFFQAQNLQKHPEASISMCSNQKFTAAGPRGDLRDAGSFPVISQDYFVRLCRANVAPIHAHMIRHNMALNVGFFDPEYKVMEDYHYWLRCAAAGYSFCLAPGGVALYRQHTSSLSAPRPRMLEYERKIRLFVHALLQADKYYSPEVCGEAWLAHCHRCLLLTIAKEDKGIKFYPNMLDLVTEAIDTICTDYAQPIRATYSLGKSWLHTYLLLNVAYLLQTHTHLFPNQCSAPLQKLLENFPETAILQEERARISDIAEEKLRSPTLYVQDFSNWRTAFR